MSLIQEALRRQQQETGEGELKSGAPPPQKPTAAPPPMPEPPPLKASSSSAASPSPAAAQAPRKTAANKEKGSGPQIGKTFFLLLLFAGVGVVVWRMVIPALDMSPSPPPTAEADEAADQPRPAEPDPVAPLETADDPRPLPPLEVLTDDIVELEDLADIVEWPNLTLDGVVGSGAQGSCLINGEIVRVGERVQNVKISAILRDGVELKYRGEKRFLRVGASTRK